MSFLNVRCMNQYALFPPAQRKSRHSDVLPCNILPMFFRCLRPTASKRNSAYCGFKIHQVKGPVRLDSLDCIHTNLFVEHLLSDEYDFLHSTLGNLFVDT